MEQRLQPEAGNHAQRSYLTMSELRAHGAAKPAGKGASEGRCSSLASAEQASWGACLQQSAFLMLPLPQQQAWNIAGTTEYICQWLKGFRANNHGIKIVFGSQAEGMLGDFKH